MEKIKVTMKQKGLSMQTVLKMSKTNYRQTEILSFRRGDNLATIATDGVRSVTQEFELCKEHRTLKSAIAYLEAKGFLLIIDGFESI